MGHIVEGSSSGFILNNLAGNHGIGPFDFYSAFMSLHPLTDGNGRTGRLLYEYLNWKQSGKIIPVTLPIFDMDLFESAERVNSELVNGTLLHDWVAAAQSDAEFLNRAEQALKALVISNPNLINYAPELGEFYE